MSASALMDDGVSMLEVLTAALRARPEIARRADRCRAVLDDLLGSGLHAHQREVNLLVRTVEQGVPAVLIATLGTSDYDAISSRLSADQALELDAARWAVETWNAALLAVNAASPESLAPLIGSDTPAAGTAAPDPSWLVTPTTASRGDSAVAPATSDGDLGGRAEREARPAVRVRQRWSQKRKRLLALSSGTLAVAIITVGAVAFGTGGSNAKAPTTSSAPTTTATVVPTTKPNDDPKVAFARTSLGAGVNVTRTWTLSGSKGQNLAGTLRFVAAKRPSKPVVYYEVLPKSLAASSSLIRVDYSRALLPQRPAWVLKDPVLQITLGFTKSLTTTVAYQVTVPPKGRSTSRLQQWRKDQAALQAAWNLIGQWQQSVAVPNVVGEPSRTAASQLTQASFVVNIHYAQSTKVAADRVISTSPGPNEQAPKGSTVTVVVSTATGPPPQPVIVKNVINEALPQAESDLASLGFNVSVAYETDSSHVNQVVAETPQGGTPEPRGTTVTLTVGKAPPISDGDRDGVPDGSDQCPTVPGPASNHGCPPPPDRDRDGVPDGSDGCPTIPGPAANHGCPYPSPPPIVLTGISGPQDPRVQCVTSFPYTAIWTVSWTGGPPKTFTWSYDDSPQPTGTSRSFSHTFFSPATGNVDVYATGSDNKASKSIGVSFTINVCP